MKKVIEFTKIRNLMIALSLVIIIGGIIGVVVQGQFNLGIDFVGGLNQRIQFAPVAFSIKYNGSGSVNCYIQGKLLTLAVTEGGQKEDKTYNFYDYATVEEMVAKIKEINSIEVDLASGYSKSEAVRLLASDFDVTLTAGSAPFKVNIQLAEEKDIFATKEKVVAALQEFKRVSVQAVGSSLNQEFIVKIHMKDIIESTGTEQANPDELSESVQDAMEMKIKEALGKTFEKDAVLFRQQDFIGPSFSKEIFQGSVWSLVVALLLILFYISVRFKLSYAVAAVAALVHDVTIMIVVIGTFQLEVTATTLAAVLTIVGYSLNDTIVVFDRVRENFGLLRDVNRETIINTSISQSLSRTIITSLTTLLAVISIYIFGSGMIKDFAFNLIIGIVVGTYSSIFIASPIVLMWMNAEDKRKKKLQEEKIGKKKVDTAQTVQAKNVSESSEGDNAQKTRKKKK